MLPSLYTDVFSILMVLLAFKRLVVTDLTGMGIKEITGMRRNGQRSIRASDSTACSRAPVLPCLRTLMGAYSTLNFNYQTK